MEQHKSHHFLIVTFPVQGHLNPSRHLAKHLTRIAGNTRVTFSTPISGHRRMFPSTTSSTSDQQIQEENITYIPFSDGDDNNNTTKRDIKTYISDLELSGSRHLNHTIANFASTDHPITCIIYTLLLPWAGRIARKHNLPCAQFWIQPATVLAICYHYFHGYQTLISSNSDNPTFNLNLPNLPPMQIRDIPTFLTITDPENPKIELIAAFKDTIEAMEMGDKVLVNTFDELEPDVMKTMREHLHMFAIGPVMPEEEAQQQQNGFESRRYIEWLDDQEEGSVVYVSFGTNLVLNQREVEQIRLGLRASGRPYLWSMGREKMEEDESDDYDKGMEIGWCEQVRVLKHGSVGCFVTHCGWNSTVESMVAGVRMVVGVARWADQATNGYMVEREWGVGVRMGEVEAEEVRRCVEMVMAEGEMRKKARMWKERARKAMEEGGSSDRNLRAFVEGLNK